MGAIMGLWGRGQYRESHTDRAMAAHALLLRLKDVDIAEIEAAFPIEGEKPKAVRKAVSR